MNKLVQEAFAFQAVAQDAPTKPTKPSKPSKPTKPEKKTEPMKETKRTEPTKPSSTKADEASADLTRELTQSTQSLDSILKSLAAFEREAGSKLGPLLGDLTEIRQQLANTAKAVHKAQRSLIGLS